MMSRWRTVHWSTVALVALPLVVGALLIAIGKDAEGSKLLLVGTGLLAGLPLTWRKDGGPPSLPPSGPAVVLVFAVCGAALAGCGSASSPTASCRAVRAVADTMEAVESYVCDERSDAGR